VDGGPRFRDALAVDPSLRSTGIVARVNGVEHYRTVRTGALEKWAAVRLILEAIKEELERFEGRKPVAVVEQYAYGASGNYLVTQGEIGGAVRYLLVSEGVPFVELAQNTWKGAAMGKAFRYLKKSRSAAYLAEVHRRTGRWFQTTDVADAWLMIRAAELIAAGTVEQGQEAGKRLRELLAARGGEG
jgi:Holliday junction resolvasome RuvABC endonuclease subunit